MSLNLSISEVQLKKVMNADTALEKLKHPLIFNFFSAQLEKSC